MNVELRKIGEAARYLSLSSIVPNRILSKDRWLQGYYLDEHAPPVVDFARLSVDSVSLANRCAARPDQKVLTAADSMFGR
jgi:hypothetical protein